MKLATTLFTLLVSTAPALAQQKPFAPKEVQTTRGPTDDVYIRKRPPTPDAPVLSPELQALLTSKEKARDDKRVEAITLLRGFLDSKPTGEARAEGMFKLAELLWEESRRVFLVKMDGYARALEKCSQKKGDCQQPVEPKIDLKEAEKLYVELHNTYPKFRRIDLVTYLIGFAAKEDNREQEAMARFEEVIKKHPKSSLYGDAWMMVGEHHFAQSDWEKAKDAYKHIPDDATSSDLATFKIAWCEWKLGNSTQAAKDFKRVLDKAVEAEKTGTAAQRRRSASLRDEALEQLVVVFTEDRSISAREVFDFLASIGGEQYSRDVLIKVAESYAGQSEWDKSNEAFRFLITMEPESIKSAEYQRDIIQNWVTAVIPDKAQDEIKVLLANFGPRSAWAKAQRNREALSRSLATTEELVRSTAKNIHAEAQRREKADKKVDIPLYTMAAGAYAEYLTAFGNQKASAEFAIELRFYRADILYFKLGKLEEAGDEYLSVGKSAPVGKWHKEALTNAMEAFEKARPKDTAGRTKLYDVDKKFGEAIDLFATLFPADPTIVNAIFKNGQMFYDYNEYDEAIKRFGVIVTKYPKDPNAGPAGDRILSALNKAHDYENIENWARKLRTAPSFAAKDQQDRLSKLIVESIQKAADKKQENGYYEEAAAIYLRVLKETNDGKLSAQAMMNAGVMYEKAKLLEKAGDLYVELADKFGAKDTEVGEKAAWAAGQVYEKVIYYDRAAKAYELMYTKFGTGKAASSNPNIPTALFNAGVLRQALGQYKEAIAHYQEYAKKFPSRKDAPDVAFNIGVVYEGAGEEGQAYRAYTEYTRTYRSSGKRVIEAWTRAGRMSLKLGQQKRARDELAQAQRLWKAASGNEKKAGNAWAAEARYHEGELIFAEYEKVKLDVPVKELEKALKLKSKLLGDAEKVYGGVLDYGDLKWATAALFRVGQTYDGFGEALAVAAQKPPPSLTPDQAQMYQDKINEYVVTIQEKAVELFAAGYGKAIQMQVYDEYTAKIREALGRLASDRFPPEREGRSKERIGDRPPKLELIQEIAR